MVNKRRAGRFMRASLTTAMMLAIAGCSAGAPEERAQKYYELAQEAYAADDYQVSVIHLKNALQELGGYLPARLFLGRIYLETYQIAQAEKELTRARDLGAAPEDYLSQLMRTYVLGGQFVKALALMEAAPQTLRNRADVRSFHADALVGQGRYKDAKDLLQQAENPTGGILARLGQIAWLENDMDLVRIYAKQALDAAPDLLESNLLMGRIYLTDLDFSAAAQAFGTALEADPFAPQAALSYAAVLVELQQGDEAIKVLNKLRRYGQESTQSAYLRALVAMQKKDYNQAKAESERVLSHDPGNRAALLVAGVANSALGNDEAAINYLRRFSVEDGLPSVARRALAWSNLRLGRPDEALSAIEGAVGQADGDQSSLSSLRLATAAAINAGQFEKAEGYLRDILEQEPDNMSIAVGLASLKLAAGDKEGADRILKSLPQEPGARSIEEQVRLALVYLGAGNYRYAMDVATRLQADSPEQAEGYSLSGLALAAQKQYDGAIGQFQQALSLEPNNMTAVSALVALYKEQNRIADADKILIRAHEADPENTNLTLMLAQVKAELGQSKASEGLLRQLTADEPDMMEPHLILSRLYLTSGRPVDALDSARQAQKLEPDNAAVLETLGLTYRMLGNHDQAVGHFERLVRLKPDSADAYYLLGRSLAEANRLDAAVGAMRHTIELNGDKLEARAGLVRLLTLRGDVDAAGSELTALKSMMPAGADIHDLEGFLALRNGDLQGAVRYYRLAYEADSASGRGVTLARAMWLAGDESGAADLLTSIDTTGALLQLAQLHSRRGKVTDAILAYRALLAKEPDNPIFLNDFAWTLWENGQIDEAHGYAKRAVEIAPKSAAIQDTYGVILLDRGDSAGAVAALRLAMQGGPQNPEFRFHLAKALLANGQRNEARSLLSSLVRLEDFNKKTEAQDLLEKNFR